MDVLGQEQLSDPDGANLGDEAGDAHTPKQDGGWCESNVRFAPKTRRSVSQRILLKAAGKTRFLVWSSFVKLSSTETGFAHPLRMSVLSGSRID